MDINSDEEPSLLNFMKQEIPSLESNQTRRLQSFEEIRRIQTYDQGKGTHYLFEASRINKRLQSYEETKDFHSLEEKRDIQPEFCLQDTTGSDKDTESTCLTSPGFEYR